MPTGKCGLANPDAPEQKCILPPGIHHHMDGEGHDWADEVADKRNDRIRTRPRTKKEHETRMRELAGVSRPYAGSSGSSGTDASADRAAYLDGSGLTSAVQRFLYQRLVEAGVEGCTSKELRESQMVISRFPQIHHGTVSGALSNMNTDRYIALLDERRDGSHVYVHPDFVNDRVLAKKRKRA